MIIWVALWGLFLILLAILGLPLVGGTFNSLIGYVLMFLGGIIFFLGVFINWPKEEEELIY